ncbi:MAG: DUF1538 domain-containing protein [Firmicutes bacterium]|jgi:hypothetical protein|nr:DUF1538 domain-containing protein [Bacillota bacterium]
MAIWAPLKETLISVLPVVIFLLAFNALVLKKPLTNPRELFSGLVLTIVGLTIFIQGLNRGLLPLGTIVGENLTASGSAWLILAFSFVLGYGMTLAEPSLQALGTQVEELSAGQMTKTLVVQIVAVGVGLGLVIGMLKVIMGWSFARVIIPLYLLAMALLPFASQTLSSLAFDSGSVTTGPITVPITMALGTALASGIGGRDPLIDGLGLVALVAISPVLCLLILGVALR